MRHLRVVTAYSVPAIEHFTTLGPQNRLITASELKKLIELWAAENVECRVRKDTGAWIFMYDVLLM